MDRRNQRVWAAVAGALGFHALVLLALTLLPRAKEVPPLASKPLRVELRKAPPGGGTPAGGEKAAPRPVASHKSTAPGSRAAAPAEAPNAGEKRALEPEPWSRDWRVGEGIDRSGGVASLRLDHPEDVRGPGGGPPSDGSAGLVREKSPEAKLAEEKATVERRMEEWLSDWKAKQRAQSRDGYWQAVEDALSRGFDPGWNVLEQGPQKTPSSTLRALVETWKKQAAAYGKSGNPFDGLPDAPGARKPLTQEFLGLANEDRGLRTPSLSGLGTAGSSGPLSLGMLSAVAAVSGRTWHYQLVASVRITQREDGSLFAVELLGTSGNAAYDRLVLGQARSLGLLELGPPRQGRETLWAFETEFSQIPPVPAVGCALDDFIPKNCWYPLQKRAHSRVRLLAIY
jgi:TonB-like protein